MSDGFEPFDASHLAALAVGAVGVVVLVVVGRRLRGGVAADRLLRGLAVALLAVTAPLQVLYNLPGSFDVGRTLPVQLCDVASLVAWALWSRQRWAAALAYFWGFTLVPQAIATPDLATGFPDPVFLLFWAMHLGTVWGAAALVATGIRVGWADWARSFGLTVVWALAVGALNAALGTNYGYLAAKPRSASVLDLLGPWPVYLLWEALLVAGVWALMALPFARGTGPRQRPRPALR